MANDLVVIETTIKEGDALSDKAGGYREKAADLLVSSGLKYRDAKRLCKAAGLNWLDKVKEISKHSARHVSRCMLLAGPETEEDREEVGAAYRAQHVEEQRAYQARKASNRPHVWPITQPEVVKNTTMVDPSLGGMDEDPFVGALSMDVIKPAADPLVPIKAAVMELTTEKTLELSGWLDDHLRRLGI